MGRDLGRVIEELYDGILDDEAWERSLVGISDLVSASGLLLMSCNPKTCEVFRFELPGLDAAGMSDYGQYWIHRDPRYAAGLRRPPGEAQVDDMLVPRGVMRRSEIYNDFLRRWDIPFCIASWVLRTPTHGVTLCIEGTRRHGPFTEEQRLRVAAVMPHLRRVLRVKDRIAKSGTRARTLLESMDRFPFGMLLLGADLSIIEASAPAREILATSDGLCEQAGRLVFRRSPEAQAFARTLTSHQSDSPDNEGVVVVRQFIRPGDLTVLTVPVAPAAGEWLPPSGRYLVLMFDASRLPRPSTTMIRRTYGLTPGEARLVTALVAGGSLADIAERHGLSVQTLRSQLKSVFAKTGARTQAQLMRLVVAGPSVLSAEKKSTQVPVKI